MKILQLCKKFPFPLNDGESIAVTYLAQALSDLGHEVSLLSMNTRKHYFDIDLLPEDYNFYHRIETTFLDNSVNYFNTLGNLIFSRKSFHIVRFDSDDFRQKLIALVKEEDYDVVLIETIVPAMYIEDIRRHSNAVIAMRAHNLEHEIWAHIAENTAFFPKKYVLNVASKRLKKYELKAMNAPDLFVAISDADRKKFRDLGLRLPAITVPIGLQQEAYPADWQSFDKPLSLSFIGSLDWMPNVEGLNWFLEKAWPAIKAHHPGMSFHIAGKKTPASIMRLNLSGVEVYGEVPDAREFINKHSVMIVPLLSGSGIRAKIIEAMMLGKVVITTGRGLEGINATRRKHVLVANTPDEFLEAVTFCQENPDAIRNIGHEARKFALRHFSNRAIARHFVEGVERLGTAGKKETFTSWKH